MTKRTQADQAVPELIDARYRTLRELGGGGMAVVYEVEDSATGRRVALKRPRSDGSPEHRNRIAELFAREYHTLVQLAHPRIVAVYDYRVDEIGPYYTMELLDGGDLHGLMPVDYRRACAIASDVCSALSLLHSRRIIHRDLSPRNIRCTSDGLAKLIDFGAMTHMGTSKELVGTPAYCAPEVYNMQTLDARTDLFALGATLYYALTEQHPYPARDFAGLPNAWRFAVARPSELVPGIPDALDTLVLDLLQLQPDARPSNAAEVMARLSAIAGRPVDEQLLVANAYLETPAFVGRTAELARVKAKTTRALRRRGAAVLIEGQPGSGRSRFLDATVLDGKLLGMAVVRADADDGDVDYGVVRRLLGQLQQLVPDITRDVAAPHLPVLGQIMPELVVGQDVPLATDADLAALRPQLQSALQRLFVGIAERRPLVIAIDDLHAADEPSTAAIGLVAQHIRKAPLVILATATHGAADTATSAFKLFANAASDVTLQNLTLEETENLLESVFGASRALEALAQRLHALSGGSPRALMRLAQHLVDSGTVRYSGGAWSLPAEVDKAELPSSLTQMLAARLAQLAEPARDLARALALSPEKSFGFQECLRLSERGDAGAVLADLEQLTRLEVVRATGERFVLSDRAWTPLLCENLAPARERELHLRLSQVFEARGDETFRHAQHLLRGGEVDRALDLFVAHAISSRALTDKNSEAFHQLLLTLPADWRETYDVVVDQLRARKRPKRDEFAVLARAAGLGAIAGGAQARMLELIALLKQASGLDDWEHLDTSLDVGARIKRAFELAYGRFAAAPETERVADPPAALRELAVAVRLPLSSYALTMNLQGAQALPSLQPFVPVAPALTVVERLAEGIKARLSGRIDRARGVYRELLQLMAAPGGAGLDPTHLAYTRLMVMNGLAVLDAACGLPSLDAAAEMEKYPTLQSNAWLVRMVAALWRGDSHEAERCRKQFDMARIQNSSTQAFESVHLPWQLTAYAAMEDLTRIKRSVDEVAPLAARYEPFAIVASYGEAEYQRIRGDAASSVARLEPLLRDCRAGCHQIWPQLAAAHVRALDEAGRSEQAVERGRDYLADATSADLGASALQAIRLATCVAGAKLGQSSAAEEAEHCVEHCRTLGASGLNLALAYEARARVAVLLDDAEGYEHYRGLCEQEYTKAANPALMAKLQKLRREAQRRKLAPQTPLAEGGQRGLAATVVKSRLAACSDATERAKAMIALLAQQSGADEGYLYQVRQGAPTWVASTGSKVPGQSLHAMVRDYIQAEVAQSGQSTGASELTAQTDWTYFGESSYRPVLLSHYQGQDCVITGLAVFVLAPDKPFVYPGEVAAQISRMLHEAGDVTGLVVEED
ncbi:MAG TPA: protein kinase [Polyangiales bacterium]|nr:protein kinase [Polyangiales bacterium]